MLRLATQNGCQDGADPVPDMSMNWTTPQRQGGQNGRLSVYLNDLPALPPPRAFAGEQVDALRRQMLGRSERTEGDAGGERGEGVVAEQVRALAEARVA